MTDPYKIVTVYVEDTRSEQERAEQMRREVQGLCLNCGGSGPFMRQHYQRFRYSSDRGHLPDGVHTVDRCRLCRHRVQVRP